MKRKTISKLQSGYTLVELSIVLVILGLIVGGVLVGGDLIHATEMKNVMRDYNNYKTAIEQFREKYNALPGDMKNATSIWGRADDGTFSGDCGDSAADSGTGTQTCNGNGDGLIAEANGGAFENFRMWEHLQNAELIGGNFTGVAGAGGNSDCLPNENVPEGSLTGSGFSAWSVSNWSNMNAGAQPNQFHTIAGNVLFFGSKQTNGHMSGPIFTPADAYDLDSKFDDGKPATGHMMVHTATGRPNCATTDDVTTAEYDLDYFDISCPMIFHYLR